MYQVSQNIALYEWTVDVSNPSPPDPRQSHMINGDLFKVPMSFDFVFVLKMYFLMTRMIWLKILI